MKRIILIALLSGLGIYGAQAGNDTAKKTTGYNTYTISSQVLKENNFRNALWMESGNTAGLAFRPFTIYKDLDINYIHKSGKYRQAQDAGTINNVSLTTSGSAYLGKFIVWGKFSFRNIFEKDRNMNVLMYEVEPDMPYYPIDTTRNSGWTKQEYELQAKLVSPILWEKVSFGADVNYVNKVGAKHLDPRAETYKYYIAIRPSATVRLANHLIGINGFYYNSYERSDPGNMNNWVTQPVYLHKGLGESIRGKVGDNDGIKDYLFSSDSYGGGIQYGYVGNIELIADVSYTIKNTDVVSTPLLPKNEGSTKRTDIKGNVAILFGKNKSDKLWIDVLKRSTQGTEYVTKIVTISSTEQYWQVLSQNIMSNYNLLNGAIGYDHQFGASNSRGYDWIVGGYANFMMRTENYTLPSSKFSATTASVEVFGGKQFKFKKSSLLIKIDGGYGMSLGSEYVFGGKNKDYQPVKLYQADCKYFNTPSVKIGGDVAYTINARKVGFIIKADADYFKPLGITSDRLYANASFGITF